MSGNNEKGTGSIPEPVARKRSLPYIRNEDLRRKKRRVALFTLWAPIFGTALAGGLAALQGGIGFLEISLLAGMFFITTFGVEVGFHRLFSHNSFKAPDWVRGGLFILGCMSGEGQGIYWASNHRRHHAHSDTGDDPHSPHFRKTASGSEQISGWKGFWHAHQGNTYTDYATNATQFANDLTRDRMLVRLDRFYTFWVLLGLGIPALIGALVTRSWQGALNGFLWGGVVRIFVGHQTYFTNGSFAHVYGSRPFKNGDMSSNNIWCALPTFGSAWQNNHHAFPSSARLGFHWWEVDIGWYLIASMQSLGLVREIKRPSPAQIRSALARAESVTGGVEMLLDRREPYAS